MAAQTSTENVVELEPGPAGFFRRLPARHGWVRFMLPRPDGTWQPVTWAEHAQAIERVALALVERDLPRGAAAAILSPNRLEWLQASMAIQLAGAVMVPVYPASTAEQIEYVLGHSRARVLFVDTAATLRQLSPSLARLPALRRVVVFDEASSLELQGFPAELPVETWSALLDAGTELLVGRPTSRQRLLDALDLRATALMLYTSGTTGRPKGVPLSHGNLAANWRDWVAANAPLLSAGAIDLLWLPFSHIFGYGESTTGDLLGFTSYLADPHDVLEVMPRVRPQVFMSVPSYWEKLAKQAMTGRDDHERRELLRRITGGRLRFCLSGGARLAVEIKQFFERHGILLLEGYGLTECSPTLTLNRHDAYRFDSVGRPLESVQLRLAADGEILAKGPSIFRGYHDDPAATAAAFTGDGWFKTGDIGTLTEDGFLVLVDRKKDILVTAGGKNIPPANIESRFAEHPMFRHVVVYGDARKYLVAGVWLDPSFDLPTPELEAEVGRRIDEVNRQLARFEQIKRFRIMPGELTVANGLLTTTLKVRRRLVWQTFGRLFEAMYDD